MLTSCLMLQWFQSWDDRGEDVELHCELGVLDNSLSVSSHSAPRSLEPIFSPLLKQYSVCQGSEDFESQARSHGYIMSVTRCSIWIQAYLARDTEAMSCGPRVSSVSMSRLREMLLSQRIYEKLCVTFHARHLKTWEQPCLVRCWELRRRRQWGVRSEPWWMTGISRKVLSEVLITRRCTIDVRVVKVVNALIGFGVRPAGEFQRWWPLIYMVSHIRVVSSWAQRIYHIIDHLSSRRSGIRQEYDFSWILCLVNSSDIAILQETSRRNIDSL